MQRQGCGGGGGHTKVRSPLFFKPGANPKIFQKRFQASDRKHTWIISSASFPFLVTTLAHDMEERGFWVFLAFSLRAGKEDGD